MFANILRPVPEAESLMDRSLHDLEIARINRTGEFSRERHEREAWRDNQIKSHEKVLTPVQQVRDDIGIRQAEIIRDRLYGAIREAQADKYYGEVGVKVIFQDGVVQGSIDILERRHK